MTMIFKRPKLSSDASWSGVRTIRRSYLLQWLLHALSMLALGGVISFQLYLEFNRIDNTEKTLLLNHIQIIARNLSMELEATRHALLGIRADPEYWIQTIATDPASQRLKTLCDAMPGVRTISVLNPNGIVLASSRHELIGKIFAGRPYFEVTSS